MLLANGDGTFTGGPLDVLTILRDISTGRYHAAFLQERPFPGPIQEVQDTPLVRLASHSHHTEGAPTLEAAQVHLTELATKIVVPEQNVFKNNPIEWNGRALVMVVDNWRRSEPR